MKIFFLLTFFFLSLALSASEQGCVEIKQPEQYNVVWALSDVHGQYDSALNLLRQAGLLGSNGRWEAEKTLLIIVGDSLNKGPKSRELLDLWTRLSLEAAQKESRLIHLLGNHEAEFLADPKNSKVNFPLPLTESQHRFLREMPLVAKVGKWIFVHAGRIDSKYSWDNFCQKANQKLSEQNKTETEIYNDPFVLDKNSPLEMKDWWKDPTLVQEQILWHNNEQLAGTVFGHQTKAFDAPAHIYRTQNGHFIKIDSGMGDANPGEILMFNKPLELNSNQRPSISSMNEQGKKIQLP